MHFHSIFSSTKIKMDVNVATVIELLAEEMKELRTSNRTEEDVKIKNKMMGKSFCHFFIPLVMLFNRSFQILCDGRTSTG